MSQSPTPGNLAGRSRAPSSSSADLVVLVLGLAVPVVFNPLGVQAFELPKATLLRLGALLLTLIFAARLWHRRRCSLLGGLSPARRCLLGAAALLWGVAVLSTVASLSPLQSLLGSTIRYQGVLTLTALAVLATTLAGRRSLETRAVDALLVGSVPVCLYALVQHFHLDPLTWLGRTFGPTSTVGTATALGGYLAMLLPLTLARADIAARGLKPRKGFPWYQLDRRSIACVLLLLLGGLQGFGVLVSGVRGALLGAGAGLAVLALLLLRRRSRRAWSWLLLGSSAALIVGLLALNLPLISLERVRSLSPYLERLGELGPYDETGRERLLLWRAAIEALLRDPTRWLLGYGPESELLALEASLPTSWLAERPDLRFDRVHNEPLDILLTTGLLGTSAYLLVLGVAIRAGLRRCAGERDPILPAALVGAVAAHLAESFFAYGSITTLLVLWTALGLLASGPERRAADHKPREPRRWQRVLAAGLALAALALLPVILSPLLADLAYRRALAYHGGENLEGEIIWLRRAALIAPDRDTYPLALGQALVNAAARERNAGRRARLLAEAEASVRQAVRLTAADPYVHFHLGLVLRSRAAAERQAELWLAAARAFDQAAALGPRRSIFLVASGQALLEGGQPAAALDRLYQAMALDGPDAERIAQTGDALAALGREEEALDRYRSALRLNPRLASAHAGLATLATRRGDLSTALEEARQAARADSRNWRYRALLAQLERAAGNRAAARLEARSALRLAPAWERDQLRALLDDLEAQP